MLQRLGPTKKRKRICRECVIVLANGLSLCAEQKVDFVQEMDDKEPITHKGVSSTQQISSLVLLCATKTRSHKKKEKDMQGVCWLFWPRDCLRVLNREWTLYKRWAPKSWLTHESVLPNKSQKGKGYAGNVLILSYRTVFMHWWESWLCTRDGCLRAEPLKRSQFHPANFFLSLNLWCKDLVPQKRKKISSECVDCFGQWTVFTCSEQIVDFVQEMGG